MSDMNERQEESTNQFLKTNGPPEGAFKPEIPPHLLADKTESERWLYEMVGISAKQNEWLIKETIGVKGAHRTIHRRLDEGQERFKKIDATLDVFTKLRDRWLSRRAFIRHIFIGLGTLLILPILGMFVVEWIKHLAGWK